MRNLLICTVIGLVLLAVSCESTQTLGSTVGPAGVILRNTYIYSKAGADPYDKGKVKVNRGEAVTIRDRAISTESKNWIPIVLSDQETTGWINKKYIHKGPKIGITLTEKTSLYVRPDVMSRSITTLQRGSSMLVLKELGTWKKVSVAYDRVGWIKTSGYIRGFKLQ